MTNYTATRVTPEQAYERYQLIKQGKEDLVYSRATMNDIKRAHPNDWKAIVAMKEWGLQGGGHSFEKHVIRPVLKGGPIAAVGIVVPPLAPLAAATGATVALHTATGGRTPIVVGTDHRGNIGVGPGHNSVAYQQRQQRKMQDNHTRQVQESFSSNPISLIRRTNPSHVYWKELEEVLPQKIKLAKELQDMFKPVNQYYSWNHKSKIYGTYTRLDNPLNIIKNAYSMKVDTSMYQRNRNYFSNLYKSMRGADISHQDILAVYGNPYIGTVTKWNELSWQRKQNLKLQYPEMERVAESIAEQKRNFYDIFNRNICDPAKRFLDEYGFAITALASTSPYGRAVIGVYKTGQAVVAIAPKMVKLITTLGSVELARQFQILYKKTSGDSSNQRLGTSGYKDAKYWNGLTDNANGLKNLGVKPKKIDEILGNIKKLKKYEHGEIKADKFGNLYKFDQAHKSSKIHLEKIEKRSDGFWNTAEVSHETGEILKPLKRWIGK